MTKVRIEFVNDLYMKSMNNVNDSEQKPSENLSAESKKGKSALSAFTVSGLKNGEKTEKSEETKQ